MDMRGDGPPGSAMHGSNGGPPGMPEETESDYSHEEEGQGVEEDGEETEEEEPEDFVVEDVEEEEEEEENANNNGDGTNSNNKKVAPPQRSHNHSHSHSQPELSNMAASSEENNSSAKTTTNKRKGRIPNSQFDGDDDLRTNQLGHANLALRRFFMSRMTENIVGLGGDAAVLLKGWQVQVTMRASMGLGLLDVMYHANGGKSYTTLISVLIALGLSSSCRSLQRMTQMQHFHAATECKEKYFLSQMLAWSSYRADDIFIADGMLQILVHGADEVDAATEDERRIKWVASRIYPVSPRPSERKVYKSQDPERLLAFGNTTVLDWGRVVTAPHFHTPHHIFPVGLRVLRIEHDVIKDELVECLCEIASIPDDSPLPPKMSEEDAAARILPLFRITVAWKHRLPGAKGFLVVNRVYEARTPHDVWTAVLAERVLTEPADVAAQGGRETGVSSYLSSFSSSSSSSSNGGSAMDTEGEASSASLAFNQPLGAYIHPLGPDAPTALSMEPQDDEERLLRNQVRELRHEHLGATEAEEAVGLRPVVEPRLSEISTDCFIDNGLLRLLEGVNPRVVNLKDYIFLDAREADANRRQIRRSLSVMHSKCNRLAKVAARDRPENSLLTGADAKSKAKRVRLVIKAKPLSELEEAQEGGQPDKPAKRRKPTQADKLAKAASDVGLAPKKRGRNQYTGPAPKPLPAMMAPDGALQPPVQSDALDMYSQTNFKSKMTLPPNISDKQADFLRELERQARMTNEVTVSHTLKARRETAKKVVAAFAKAEEQRENSNRAAGKAASAASVAAAALVPRAARPEGTAPRLQGDTFTKVLDLWDFLSTFGPILNVKEIPSLEGLVSALQAVEPRTPLNASTFTTGPGGLGGPQSLAGAMEGLLSAPSTREAAELLNTFGILLCEWVRADYEKYMGIDPDKGMSRLPINSLTWREVAYTILMHYSMRECSFNEADTQSTLRGKGQARTISESLENKAMRLAKRRIEFQYLTRAEFQESVVGFSAGVIVRVPAPASFSSATPQDAWSTLIESLDHCPDGFGWIALETIDAAIRAVQGSNCSVVARIKRDLRQCQATSVYKPEDCRACKAAARAVLRWDPWSALSCSEQEGVGFPDHSLFKAAPSSSSSSSSFPSSSSASSCGDDAHELPPGTSPSNAFYYDSPPQTAFEHVERQARFFTATATTKPYVLPRDEGKEDEDEDEEEKEDNEEEEEKEEKKGGEEEEEEGKIRRRVRQNRVRSELERRLAIHQRGLATTNPLDAIDEADEPTAVTLPVAMQRCYYLLCSFMRMPIACAFAFATPKSYAALYMHIPEPLALMDIRRTLVEGGYNGQLTRFYADVIINFENAMSYHPEHTEMFRQAARCVVIFERLFLEMVMAWDHPLPYTMCCGLCRDVMPVDPHSNRAATCDRCDGYFHLHCLSPPLARAPRKEDEWICPCCVEQRSVVAMHPCKTSKVRAVTGVHAGKEGEIIGIETAGNTLRFCVQLAADRETWSGRQVREGCRAYAAVQQGVPVDDGIDMRHGVPVLPSGYDYDDYDSVAGYAVGYSGWGVSALCINPYINFGFSFASRRKSQVDPLFEGVRRSVAALSTHAPAHTPGAAEWVAILRALMTRVTSGSYGSQATSSAVFSALQERVGELDEDQYKAKFRSAYTSGILGFDKLIRPISVPQTGRLVLRMRLEVEAEERNREYAKARALTRTGARGIWNMADTEEPMRCQPYESDASTISDAIEVCSLDESSDEEGQKAGRRTRVEETLAEAPMVVSAAAEPSEALTGSSLVDSLSSAEWSEEACRALLLEPAAGPSAARPDEDPASGSQDSSVSQLLRSNVYRLLEREFGVWAVQIVQTIGIAKKTDRASGPALGGAGGVGADGVTRGFLDSYWEARQVLWELKRLSRKRGRDDAMLHQSMLLECLAQLDLSGDDDDGRPFVETLGAYVMPFLARIFQPRISEMQDLAEWRKGWQQVMSHSLDLRAQAGTDFCSICGQTEAHIASALVCGQTLAEWTEGAIDKQSRKAVLPPHCIDARQIFSIPQNGPAVALKSWLEAARAGKQWVYARDQVREAEEHEYLKFAYTGEILPSVGCSADPKDAGFVAEVHTFFPPTLCPATLHFSTFPPRAGGLQAHEFCAEKLHDARRISFQRQKNVDLHRVEEMLESVGKGKTPCLGKDRTGGRYWIFVGAPYLFISRPADLEPGSEDSQGGGITGSPSSSQRPAQLRNPSASPLAVYLQGKAYVPDQWVRSQLSIGAAQASERQMGEFWAVTGHLPDACPEGLGGLQWSVYRSAAEVGQVMAWLDKEDETEHLLRLMLSLLFPTAEADAAAEGDRPHVATAAAAKGSPSVEEDNETNEARPGAQQPAAAVMQMREVDVEEVEDDQREAEMEDDGLQDTESEKDEDEDEDEDVAEAPRVKQRLAAPLRRTPRSEAEPIRGGNRAGLARQPASAELLPPAQWEALVALPLQPGQRVLVLNDRNGLYWDATVLHVRPGPPNDTASAGSTAHAAAASSPLVKVRFDEWGEGYDAWFPRRLVLPFRGPEARKLRDTARLAHARLVCEAPDPICHLRAWAMLQELDRRQPRPAVFYSDATVDNPLGTLRAAMLTVEAALPPAALEVKRDGLWGREFVLAWRDAVVQCPDALGLMHCMLLLEIGIKAAWLRPSGVKLLAALPNKSSSIRRATVALVATRLFALDAALLYGKRDAHPGRASKLKRDDEDFSPLPPQLHPMVVRTDKSASKRSQGGKRGPSAKKTSGVAVEPAN